jgi:hypothetical protein
LQHSYSAVVEPSLRALVDQQMADNAMIEPILDLLAARDVGNLSERTEGDYSSLRMSLPALQLRRVKKAAVSMNAVLSNRFKGSGID